MKTKLKACLFLSILFLTAHFAKAQCLSGAYTIGGTAPDYATFTQAVTALTTNGVCGPVVFNVRAGTYTEQITVPAISGASASNSITFQSENGDSSSVSIRYASTSSANYVIKLDGTSFIRFSKLGVNSTGTTYSGVFLFATNGVNDFVLNNCVLTSVMGPASNSNRVLINTLSSNNFNCVIKNNRFVGGTIAIAYGSQTSTVQNVEINDNAFIDQYLGCVYVTSVNSAKIYRNTVSSTQSSTGGFVGISVSSCNGATVVERNKVAMTFGQGIYFNYCHGGGSLRLSVMNNVVQATAPNNVSGIRFDNSSDIDVYHNTVVANGPGTTGYAIYNSGSGNLDIKNNILYQKGSGYVIYHNSILAGNQYDYNNLFSGGSSFSYYNGVSQINMPMWKANGFDTHSLNYMPQFVSPTDLHSANDFSENLVMPFFPAASPDIDGIVRSTTSPYFGAYEFQGPGTFNDASVKAILNPTSTVCASNQPVEVQLKNSGLSSLSSVTLNWTVNGVAQTPFNWAGNLTTGDTNSVVIGTVAFVNLGTYLIKIWPTLPNGSADEFALNDTSSATKSTMLNGIYTIGGASPSFSTVTQAVTELTNRGICGPVTFNLRPGAYTEQITIPSISGSSAVNTILFQSENGDSSSTSIEYNGTFVVKLNGANYIRFSRLGLKNTGTSYPAVFVLQSNANNFTLDHSIVQGIATNYTITTTSNYLIYAATNATYNLSIKNNVFNGGARAISYDASQTLVNALSVMNNIFNNQYEAAIYVSDSKKAIITGNVINSPTNINVNYNGINLSYCNDTVVVSKNRMIIKYGTGMSITFGNGLPGYPILVSNNCISPVNTIYTLDGIRLVLCSNMDVLHNTVSTCGTTNNLCLLVNASSDIRIKNNIFENKTQGSVFNLLNTITNLTSDYNSLFTSGPNFSKTGTVYQATIGAWKALGYDTHSLNNQGFYVSSTDLHVTSDFSQNLVLPYFSRVPDDLDGTVRDISSPYFGAYEFANTTNLNDAAVPVLVSPVVKNCAGISPVTVQLANFGTQTLSQVTFNWSISGVAQTPYTWTGSLGYYDTTQVTIGNITFNPGAQQSIKIWTTSPNGSSDTYHINDTVSLANMYTRLSGTYTIGTAGNYATIASAITDLVNKGICNSTTFNINNGTYNESLVIPAIDVLSPSNYITFQSTSLNNTSVTIGTTTASALTVNNARNLKFRYLHFNSSGAASFDDVVLGSSNTDVEFSNCKFTAAAAKICVNVNPAIGCRTLNINNCLFVQGATGFKASNTKNIFFINNTGAANVSLTATDTSLIRQNSISITNTSQGVSIDNSRHTIIEKNIISTARTVIAFTNLDTTNIIRNNFLTLTGTLAAYGIDYGSPALVCNNTVKITNTNVGSSAIAIEYYSLSSWGAGMIRNNIFYNSGGGYCITRPAVPVLTSSMRNNCYYKTGSNFAQFSGTSYTSLSQWQNATGKDTASIYVNPVFTSATDLHVHEALLKQAGYATNGNVTDDIDGDPRNSSNPDIGADEFVLLPNDASANRVVLTFPVCSGSQPIPVELKNNGTTTLNSAVIKVEVNGVVQPLYNWVGTLAAGQTTIVSAANYGFLAQTTYTIKAWSQQPNGSTDALPQNDTTRLNFVSAIDGGIYTIGGTSPNFATINAAVTALKNSGVCGPVVFNIRNGNYTEQVRIGYVRGASSVNTVTFKSENNDSSLVTLQYSSTAAATNYTLNLDSTKFVTFSKIGIKALGSSYGTAIAITGTASDCAVKNNILTASSSSNNSACLSKGSTTFLSVLPTANNFTIIGNAFKGTGAYALLFNGDGNTKADSALFVSANTFAGNFATGLSVAYKKYSAIRNNIFTDPSSVVAVAINASFTLKSEVSANRISLNNATGKGILLSNSNYAAGFGNSLFNNFVSTKGINISLNSCTETAVNYNSCYQNGGNAVFDVRICSATTALNNVFYKTTAGKVVYLSDPGQFTAADHNDVYSVVGDTLFKLGTGPFYNTLSAYTSATGMEGHSVSGDPYFVSYTDLHTNVAASLDAQAVPVAGITTDIDGETRNSTTPDIGADEFTLLVINNEAQLLSVYLASGSCAGPKILYAKIKSVGADTLHTLSFNCRVNGVLQTPYIWTGALAQGQIKDSIPILNHVFFGQSVVKVWTYNPNGLPDFNTINDTIQNYTTQALALNGTYVIGGSAPDFVSLTAARNALVSYGVCAPVYFDIRPGTYTDTIAIPLITGNSAVNTITFRSENGDSSSVVITDYASSSQSSPYVIALKNTKNILFSKLSFQQAVTTGYQPRIIHIMGTIASNNIQFNNCRFIGNAVSTYLIKDVNTAGMQNIAISNCYFSGASSAIEMGQPSASNIQIRNNRLINQQTVGITIYGNSSVIEKNTISTYSTVNAITAITCYGNFDKVSANKIRIAKGTGLYTSGDKDTVANNFIYMPCIICSANSGLATNVTNSIVSYNTVRMASAMGSYAFSGGNLINDTISNNIFEVKYGTGALVNANNFANGLMDHNRYYNTGTSFSMYNGQIQASLGAFKVATGRDLNSQFQPCYFVNDSTYIVSGDYDLDAHAITVTHIQKDIEDHPRNTLHPDIGAYEFNLAPNDAGVIRYNYSDSVQCAGPNSISVKVKNFGAATLTSTLIKWRVNGVQQPDYSWSGNLQPGDSTDVTIGTINLQGGRKNQLVLYTSSPNGATDLVNNNDTVKTINYRTRLNGTYTVGGSSPDYTTLSQALDTLKQYGVCGPVLFDLRNGTYSGDYHFTSIYGASNSNTITIQSEAHDSTGVVLQQAANGLELAGITHLKIHQVTIQKQSPVYYYSISTINSVSLQDFEVSNCVLTATYAINPITIANLYFSYPYTGKDIRFANNKFLVYSDSPSNFIKVTGQSNQNLVKGVTVNGNVFTPGNNVLTSYVDSITVSGNTGANIDISQANNTVIIKNNKLTNGYIKLSNTAAGMTGKIYNNVIDTGNVVLDNAPSFEVFNNTVVSYVQGFYGPNNACIYMRLVNGQRIYNNVFVNRLNGPVVGIADMAFNAAATTNLFKNNVISGGGSVMALIVNAYPVTNATFAQWQSTFQQDLNSVNALPVFTGVHDFHINNDTRIDDIGAANPYLLVDFDGMARNVASPDPGAYEFTATRVNNDAGIVGVNFSSGFCSGYSNPVPVRLKNFGSNMLTNVQINCTINGNAQPAFVWTGSLAPDSMVVVNVATFTPQVTGVYDFVISTLNPNGIADPVPYNDSVTELHVRPMIGGSYTIGGTGADFADINIAVSTMKNQGICSATIFNIHDGNYILGNSLDLNAVPGNTTLNYPITFQSLSGNPTAVIVNPTYSSNMACVEIHDIKNLTIKNLTLTGPGTSGTDLINIGNNAENILFSGNILDYSHSAVNNANNVVFSNQYHRNIRFYDNTFKGARMGIYYTHTAAAAPENIFIEKNRFSDFAGDGIYISNTDSVVIDSNTIIKNINVNVGSESGIFMHMATNSILISRNIIMATTPFSYGIYLTGSNSTNTIQVVNNVLSGSYSYGAIWQSASNASILYNSIDAQSGYGLTVDGFNTIVKNNIIHSVDPCLNFPFIFSMVTSAGNNDYFCTGPVFAKKNTTTYSTFISYKTASGLDANSVTLDPQFISQTDLHYTNVALDGLAVPISGITVDQQNMPRDPLTPNPGAYESAPDTIIDTVNKYLVLTRIETNALVVGANNPITASILYTIPAYVDTSVYKYRGDIDSLRIHYIIGNQPEVTEIWHGALHLNDSLVYTFTDQFYVPNGKQYKLKVWFENINPNQHEINLLDDSLRKTINLPMAGDYTVGGAYPDFNTFANDAAQSILDCGTSANIRMLFRPGMYGDVTFDGGSSQPVNGLIELRSETSNASDVVVGFNFIDETDSIRFSDLTIVPGFASTTYGPYDGAQIRCVAQTYFDSCIFRGGSATSLAGGLHFMSQYNGISSSITNCRFHGLNQAVYLSAYATYCSSFGTGNFVFENNVIDSCNYGVIITSMNPGKPVSIINNEFNVFQKSLYIYYQGSGFGTTYQSGIAQISGNKINSANAGIDVHGGTAYQLTLVNNMIASQNTAGYQFANTIQDIQRLRMYNNSFDQGVEFGLADSSEIYNNIFAAGLSTMAAVYIGCDSGAFILSDNNNYFAPNDSNKIIYSQYNPLGNTTTSYTFSSVIQLAATLHIDSNSVEFTPLFVSSTDLHSQSVNMKDKAKVVPAVTIDIDGDSRLVDRPDIGADEIQLVYNGVWPGDADNDLSVSGQDLFPVGLNYNDAGYPRDTITNVWAIHLSNSWLQLQPGGLNMMFADCNGDGTINMDDTLAINQNFALTHPARLIDVPQVSVLDPDLVLSFDKPQYNAGDTVNVSVQVGSSTNVQVGFYGAAFQISYDPSLVVAGSEQISYNNSWVGNINQSEITFRKVRHSIGTADFSIVRTTHTDVTGYGQIGKFRFVLQSMITSTQLQLTVLGGIKVSHTGMLNPLTTGIDTVTLIPGMVGLNPNAQTNIYLSAYPNPTTGTLTLKSNSVIGEYTLYDMPGRAILKGKSHEKQTLIELGDIPAGSYILKTPMGIVKIVKN